tara:strand:- start:206 stop:421 length:216 start_codon:yes stop_codon:yes gene_type:complete
MKSVFAILKNLRNLLPYFVLISIYFFFINLEAKNEKKYNRNTEYKNKIYDYKSNSVDKEMRITIPVIPYEQ